MSIPHTPGSEPPAPRRSASAEAAAVRHGLLGEIAAFEPPPASRAGADDPSRMRRSAHAEAAALRWHEQHPCAPE